MRLNRFLAALAACLLAVAPALAPTPALAASVNADVTVRVAGRTTVSNDVSSVRADIDESNLVQITAGTGTGKADLIFTDERTLASSATENLDLAGSLTDPFGSTLTFVKVKCLIVEADGGNTNNVVLGGAASNTFTGPFSDASDKVSVAPGTAFVVCSKAGWTVTASTGDILLVANSSSGSGVTYRITIIGATA